MALLYTFCMDKWKYGEVCCITSFYLIYNLTGGRRLESGNRIVNKIIAIHSKESLILFLSGLLPPVSGLYC